MTTSISTPLDSGHDDDAARRVYLARGKPASGDMAHAVQDIYGAPQFEAIFETERGHGDAINRIHALVSHSHGRAHTPALTPPHSPDQSGQGRPPVYLSGAPMTPHSNNSESPALSVPRLTMQALYARAGLPVPIYSDKPTQTHDSRAWDSKIGVLTHTIAGRLASSAQTLDGRALRVLIAETVGATVKDRSLGRLDRARIRVTGMATQYLTHFMPPSPAVFLGAELAAGGGRVDLAWDDPEMGVFFDEIKTWRHVQATLDEDTWTQVHRYLDAGIAAYGDRFAGVRVITLSHLRSCIYVSPQGLVESLHNSPLAPVAFGTKAAA
ncbi:hypothetical protein E9549_05405 [Blastococcus sp. MG754426]|uniref:hypothetical protein n=1 Tax=unclassified Blastococcus TaxID=2619396 RepID=UPI001EEFAB77|nr:MULTISPECIES: hypothetical protein [unclassified Blastococcus]MCF6506844.1 hypothetical protein [Blastococcus sp. MG754426]MCF6511644.1 hypothetical protein [Blastococcus sp. MG754427]